MTSFAVDNELYILGLDSGQIYRINSTVLAGDYNNDDLVNALDFLVWWNTLGSTSDLRADGDSSGLIDYADFRLIRRTLGFVTVLPRCPLERNRNFSNQGLRT